MTTPLKTPVRRELAEIFLNVDKQSRGRPIIVEIEYPGLFKFRWKGTRKRYEIGAAKLMQWAIQDTVERERREKKAARKRK
jgi:hypothetical protein